MANTKRKYAIQARSHERVVVFQLESEEQAHNSLQDGEQCIIEDFCTLANGKAGAIVLSVETGRFGVVNLKQIVAA